MKNDDNKFMDKNSINNNLFYYFIPITYDLIINKDLIKSLNTDSEYLKGNVKSILKDCKCIKSSFDLIDYLKNNEIDNYIKNDLKYDNFDCNKIINVESNFYTFKNLYIDNKNEDANLKYLGIKLKINSNNIGEIVRYNRIIFKSLCQIDNYFINNKPKELDIKSEIYCYNPRVLSILFTDEKLDDSYSQVSNLLSNASDDGINKTKTESIHVDTLYSTSIRGGNIIKYSNDKKFIETSFEPNYKNVFLLAVNQIMICEYENGIITEQVKDYKYKKTDNKKLNNIIINIKRQIASYFFDVTTNVVNINLFYRDLLVNFVLEPSQKELEENVEILNNLVNINVDRKRNIHDKIGKFIIAVQAIALIILAVLQVIQDDKKGITAIIGAIVGAIALVIYIVYLVREK